MLGASGSGMMDLAPTKLRSLLPQLTSRTITLRNRAYAAPACKLRDGRVLIWQDSGHCQPAGELRCKRGAATLTVAADNLSAMEPRLQGLESLVPSQACTALVEHALASVLDLLEALAGHSLACEEFCRIEAPRSRNDLADEPLLRIGFVLRSERHEPVARGWVSASPSFWNSLEFPRAPALPTQRHEAVPLALSVQLGHCRLTLAELRDLEIGDALRIAPRLARRESIAVRLVHADGLFGCSGRFADNQLTVETPMSILTDTTSPTQPAPTFAQGSRPSSEDFLSSVECDLTFELGAMRMSLGEIAKLRPGHAVHLGTHLHDQPVRILASGRQIARGELAAVGDELVVVVTQTNGLPDL